MIEGMRIGALPGSFDPLTVAHLAIADAAVAQLGLDRLDLVVSEVPLAKEEATQSPVAERIAAIERASSNRPCLRARVTEAQLLVDIAEGYDVLVIGADKWHQLHDPVFYGGSAEQRDAALGRLPVLAIARRHGVPDPPGHEGTVLLAVDPAHRHVSSSAVRAGRDEWRA